MKYRNCSLALLLVLNSIAPASAVSANWYSPRAELTEIGRYASGVFDEGAAEIVAYDAKTRRVFVVNANDRTVDVLDLRRPGKPTLIDSIDVTQVTDALGAANSVAVARGVLAVAVERNPKQDRGIVAFYNTRSLDLISYVTVGALPDSLAFTPDGKTLLVANEGEPDDDYLRDPEGSISIIDLKRGPANAKVSEAGFGEFNADKDRLVAAGVRVFGPEASVAQDMEPEFIAVDKRGRTAFVVLQEANALAFLDIRRKRITGIKSLGLKDHSLPGNELDASDRDDTINIRNWPVYGMYQPDAIASYSVWGQTFLVTANEGDSRDYDGYSEEARVDDLELDPAVYPDASALQASAALGRLKTTIAGGDTNSDGRVERILAYGARSFSIWNQRGEQIWDSGSDFEFITANLLPDEFNSNNDENGTLESRSDDKGPEPEGVAIGRYFGQTYAFVGLERIGGIMVYNISNPYRPHFESYINSRDFSVENAAADGSVGDLGPEGIAFVPWWKSPTWRPLVLVGNEVSGTTTVYQLGYDWER